MSLSPIAFFGALDETNPKGSDSRTISDDQHRNILASMKQQAPNWTAAVTATHGDVNLLAGYVAAGQKPLPGVGGATVIWFYANTVPPGYAIEAVDTNLRNLSIAPGGAVPVGGGTIAGDIDPSAATLNVDVANVTVDMPANTGGHTLVKAEVPNTGEVIADKDPLYLFSNASTPSPVSAYPIKSVTAAGGDGAHSHPIGGVASQTVGTGIGSTADFNPRRAMGVMGKLNA